VSGSDANKLIKKYDTEKYVFNNSSRLSHHDKAEVLIKLVLNTNQSINQPPDSFFSQEKALEPNPYVHKSKILIILLKFNQTFI
jgi:hypothetical protein